MKHPSQEDLLGYVLGALDAQEQRHLQQQIDNDPALEDTLLELKAALVPLDCMNNEGSRPGLARRTCEAVVNWDPKSAGARLAFLDHTSIDWNEGGIDDSDQQHNTPQYDHDAKIAASKFFGTAEDATDNNGRAAHRLNQTSSTPAGPAFDSSITTVDIVGQAAMTAPQQFGFRSSWNLRDMLVAAGALAMLASLLLPAIYHSRQGSQVLACQNNLRQLGMAFRNYSAIHDGGFIKIPLGGNLAASGCYGPVLKQAGLLEDDSLLACPGVDSETPMVIPSVAQINAAETEEQRLHYRRTMGGHFGHSMGYRDGDDYRGPRDGTAQLILLADQPAMTGDRQSQNHGGRGQNCLFSDGRVEFVSGPAYGTDLVYENDYGIVGPGANMLDNVIAPSHLSPAF